MINPHILKEYSEEPKNTPNAYSKISFLSIRNMYIYWLKKKDKLFICDVILVHKISKGMMPIKELHVKSVNVQCFVVRWLHYLPPTNGDDAVMSRANSYEWEVKLNCLSLVIVAGLQFIWIAIKRRNLFIGSVDITWSETSNLCSIDKAIRTVIFAYATRINWLKGKSLKHALTFNHKFKFWMTFLTNDGRNLSRKN